MKPRRDLQSIVYFSRGRGKGHAVPDMAIAEVLRRIYPGVLLTFVSYDAGAEVMKQRGENVIDLELPESARYLDVLLKATAVCGEVGPDIVISHEEFAAVPAASVVGLPSVFLTHWFIEEHSLLMDSLRYVKRVVMMEHEGVFLTPSFLAGKVEFTGPVVRTMTYSRTDRQRAKAELEIRPDHQVISVLPGGWATEERAPIRDLVIDAVRELGSRRISVIWVAGSDAKYIAEAASLLDDCRVKESVFPLEQVLVASDVCITKTNSVTTTEAYHLGVPSVSLTHQLNPMDDFVVSRIPTNIRLDARACDGPALSRVLRPLLEWMPPLDTGPAQFGRDRMGTTQDVAAALADAIDGATKGEACDGRRDRRA